MINNNLIKMFKLLNRTTKLTTIRTITTTTATASTTTESTITNFNNDRKPKVLITGKLMIMKIFDEIFFSYLYHYDSCFFLYRIENN